MIPVVWHQGTQLPKFPQASSMAVAKPCCTAKRARLWRNIPVWPQEFLSPPPWRKEAEQYVCVYSMCGVYVKDIHIIKIVHQVIHFKDAKIQRYTESMYVIS